MADLIVQILHVCGHSAHYFTKEGSVSKRMAMYRKYSKDKCLNCKEADANGKRA